jgi:hypothetical protein
VAFSCAQPNGIRRQEQRDPAEDAATCRRARNRREVSPKEDSWGEQLSHTVGYWTDVSYVVPLRLSAEDVVSLFKERLPRWHQQSWRVDGTLIACFDRNGATVALDTTGMELLAGATQKTYALTIDHNGGNCD